MSRRGPRELDFQFAETAPVSGGAAAFGLDNGVVKAVSLDVCGRVRRFVRWLVWRGEAVVRRDESGMVGAVSHVSSKIRRKRSGAGSGGWGLRREDGGFVDRAVGAERVGRKRV